MTEKASPWWKGRKGEAFVAGQFGLMALVLFGPRSLPWLPAWPDDISLLSTFAGYLLLAAGACIFTAAIFQIGHGLAPVPYPRDCAVLVETGLYAVVRHPLYCAGFLIAIGWGLTVHGWLNLAYALILLVIFDIKSRKEETWLRNKYPAYEAYSRRVRKLIPFVY